mmetsp:Transcript_139580/g.246736  ORF Transcript_139580/g.246736 Transcript_139580/m.246736 type:complete len:91 (-) Transcript_139580:54-326(-)
MLASALLGVAAGSSMRHPGVGGRDARLADSQATGGDWTRGGLQGGGRIGSIFAARPNCTGTAMTSSISQVKNYGHGGWTPMQDELTRLNF